MRQAHWVMWEIVLGKLVVHPRRCFQLAIVGLALGCSDGSSEPISPFEASVTSIVVEVDYAMGAEPYTGSAGQLGDLWTVFGDNARRLFGGVKSVSYPNQLDQMELLTDVRGESFSTEEILSIADAHRDQVSSASTVTYYVLWLDGLFRDGEIQQNVIGISIGNTGVIA
ncbi:MAG: hypothetical protein AAF449_03540, partial [Myxococcota bacterium]